MNTTDAALVSPYAVGSCCFGGGVYAFVFIHSFFLQFNDYEMTAFPVPTHPLPREPDGAAFNLYNNVWNTKYVVARKMTHTHTCIRI